MDILSVNNLCKRYDGFALQNISFGLSPGSITGFIGRNGAGKTTTLKSLLNLVHPDSGEIRFFGKPFRGNEFEIKQRLGFVSGGIDYYPKKKIKTITGVTKRFYGKWDDGAYRRYMEMFSLDEEKTPCELSEGMKVKYSLALALSHHAELLVLDEPTSGLDPVSRDDLLDVFLGLAEDEGVSILFSTHITSDLEKCAGRIIYIKNGVIYGDDTLDSFQAKYKVLELKSPEEAGALSGRLIGCKRSRTGYCALVKASDLPARCPFPVRDADLESIMVHIEKE